MPKLQAEIMLSMKADTEAPDLKHHASEEIILDQQRLCRRLK